MQSLCLDVRIFYQDEEVELLEDIEDDEYTSNRDVNRLRKLIGSIDEENNDEEELIAAGFTIADEDEE